MNLFKYPRPVLISDPNLPWASGSVFNPGSWFDGTTVHMLFRAVPSGYTKVELNATRPTESNFGFDETYISKIGYAKSTNGMDFEWHPVPVIGTDQPHNTWGSEDPRITFLDGKYWITYTALSLPAFHPVGSVRIGLASTADFIHFEHHGLVGPPGYTNKDAVIFPRRIDGKIVFMHRIAPDIQLAYFDDFDQLINPEESYWIDYMANLDKHVIMRPEMNWEIKKIGAGPTPIETEEGWLLIYHGVDDAHVYRAGVALLDLDNPSKVIYRSKIPLFEPDQPFELVGDVNCVVFPEGAYLMNGYVHIHYGAADKVIGLATVPLDDLLTWLKKNHSEIHITQ
jgi:beta-1,2-mannobiose phosphorylase / 1,2-beta-oligomannan phosphorylase